MQSAKSTDLLSVTDYVVVKIMKMPGMISFKRKVLGRNIWSVSEYIRNWGDV